MTRPTSPDARASESAVDLDGLSPTQLQAVRAFVAHLRTPEGERELARAEFAHFWDDWTKRAPDISDDEAEQIAREAVAFARRRA